MWGSLPCVCVCVCLSNLAVSIITRWWKQQVNVVTPTAGGTLSQSSIMGAFKEISSSSKSKLFRKYSNESLNGRAVCFCGDRSFQPNLVEDGADRLIRSAVAAARHRKRWSLRPCSGWHQRRVKKKPKTAPNDHWFQWGRLRELRQTHVRSYGQKV